MLKAPPMRITKEAEKKTTINSTGCFKSYATFSITSPKATIPRERKKRIKWKPGDIVLSFSFCYYSLVPLLYQSLAGIFLTPKMREGKPWLGIILATLSLNNL